MREKEKATIVDLSAGQSQAGITFKVPVEERYPVRGVLAISAGPGLNAGGAHVALVSLDGGGSPIQGSQQIDLEVSSVLLKIKYFKFENVLPGPYTAMSLDLGGAGTRGRHT